MSKAIVSAAAKEQAALLESMPAPLRLECEAIQALTSEVSKKNVFYYHDVGTRCARVHKDTHKYGESAIDKMAAATDIDSSTLYKAISFTELFTKDELKVLLERRTCRNTQIHWSHFSQILFIGNKAKVDNLVEVIFAKGLSIRELRDELKKKMYSGLGGGSAPRPRSVSGGLQQMGNMATRMVEKFDDEFGPSVFEPLEKIEDDQITPEILAKVAENREALDKLSLRSADSSKALGKLYETLNRTATAVNARRQQAEADAAKKAAEEPAKAKAVPKVAPKAPSAKVPVPAARTEPRQRTRRPIAQD